MFTGLVQGTGKVVALLSRGELGARLTLRHPLLRQARAGDSIAINGCCLTVTEPADDHASFDILAETLRLTNLGDLDAQSIVNLEPSLLPTDRMGGHFVTGHVDAVATITFWGDGMSLTVADLIPGGCTLWIIPHTLLVTNLAQKNVGDKVNIETDLLAKYSARLLGRA
ncbi:MAG: riboflavin synthase [Verrucomicrobia bacterium]|nr:riboflavin synthase [Verrucomicrobiota bacterium]